MTARATIVLYALMWAGGSVSLVCIGGPALGPALAIWLIACFGVIVSMPHRTKRGRGRATV